MAIEQRNYDPAVMYGANKNMTVDLGDVLDSNENTILEFDAVASATNYLRLANAATADAIVLSVQGTADRGMEIHNDQGEEILILTPVATAVNQLTITNSATGNPVLLSNDGEVDIGFEFHAKDGEEILKLEATAAATTFVSIKSQSTGVNPEISAEGEADLGITFMNDQSEQLLVLNCNATAVNEVQISNSATGNAVDIAATGGDTNIDISLTPKGTGGVLYVQKTEVVAATNVITAAESGSVFFLASATEFVSTLPAVAEGLHFTFFVSAAPAAASYTIVVAAAATVILGQVVTTDVNSATDPDFEVSGVGTITLVDGKAVKGDRVDVFCDGTNYYATAFTSVFDAVTFS